MKTPEELKVLKEEGETLNKKLADLSEEELKEISGGGHNYWGPLSKIEGGIADKDGGRVDYRVHCTKCGGSWWPMDVPDMNTCPACGAHGTLVR